MFGNSTLKEVLFNVEERPVFYPESVDEDGSFGEVKQFLGKKALFREDTKSPLGIVGDNWNPVLNEVALNHFDAMCKGSNINYELGECLIKNGGAKTSIEIKFPDKQIVMRNGDNMELRGYLHNGFDGMTSVGLELGFFRYWCSNGAIVGTKEYQMKFKHTTTVESRINNALKWYLDNKINETHQFITTLSETPISDNMIREEIEKQDLLPKKYESEFDEALKKESSLLQGAQNLWLLYNAYTRVITHDMNVESYRKLQLLNQLSTRARLVWLNNPLIKQIN